MNLTHMWLFLIKKAFAPFKENKSIFLFLKLHLKDLYTKSSVFLSTTEFVWCVMCESIHITR